MKDTINIAIDSMGSETNLDEIVIGLEESALRNENIKFTIFGNKNDLNYFIDKTKALKLKSSIIHCDEEVIMADKPTEVIRSKKKSSMHLSIDHVNSGLSDAVISCGNTGALMALSLLKLRTIASIKRPAIASIWPNLKGESIVLDLGANVKNESSSLIDNAILGSALAKALFNMDNPSIGLLNVGIEDTKGNDVVQKASETLIQMNLENKINYLGFIEGNDIAIGKTNVVVTDGFTGNVALKTAEGTANMVKIFFKNAFESSLISKMGYFMASLPINTVKQKLDPSVHNCGIFIGLSAPVIKCHGNSNHLGISYASDIAYSLIEKQVNQKVKMILADNKD